MVLPAYDAQLKDIYQHTFNRVAEHLIRQGKKSVDANNRCSYRGPDNTCCGVGVLIPDERYYPDIEGESCGEDSDVLDLIGDEYCKDVFFLQLIQRMHDGNAIQFWPRELRALAKRYDLQAPKWLQAQDADLLGSMDLEYTRKRLLATDANG